MIFFGGVRRIFVGIIVLMFWCWFVGDCIGLFYIQDIFDLYV